MLDEVILAAIREEYNAATRVSHRSEKGFLRFAVGYVYDAFHDNNDDACFDWISGIIEKHAAAILAHNPEIAEDEELMDLWFSDWDLKD